MFRHLSRAFLFESECKGKVKQIFDIERLSPPVVSCEVIEFFDSDFKQPQLKIVEEIDGKN